MSARLLAVALILPFLTSACQSEYLRGYAAGVEREREFYNQVARIDKLDCEYELTNELAKNKICEGLLEACKVGRKCP